jgi:hypothetical protein
MKTLSPYARMRRACGARRRVLALAAGLLPLLPGAASRVGRAAVIGPPPAPPAPYAYDDGTDEQAIGVSSDPPEPYSTAQTAWMNAFVVTPGHETINALYVAYGSYAQGSNGIPNGQPAHVFLLSDSNNDGNPADAQVVRDITSSVSNVDNGTFNRVPITPVTMLPGQVFFVGAIVTGLPLDRYPGPVGHRRRDPRRPSLAGRRTGRLVRPDQPFHGRVFRQPGRLLRPRAKRLPGARRRGRGAGAFDGVAAGCRRGAPDRPAAKAPSTARGRVTARSRFSRAGCI